MGKKSNKSQDKLGTGTEVATLRGGNRTATLDTSFHSHQNKNYTATISKKIMSCAIPKTEQTGSGDTLNSEVLR